MPRFITSSRKRLILLCAILCVLGFTCVGSIGYRVYRTWNPWVTQDIDEYPEMRQRLVKVYPRTPDILPLSIPASATVIQFVASPYGGLRDPPCIDLELKMTTDAAQTELKRLRALDANWESFDSTTDDDGVISFEYHLGEMSTYHTDAVVSYDPTVNTFGYHLGAGY